MPQPRLVVATNNLAKVSEFRDLLAGCGWQIVAPADLGIAIDVEESGATYANNARLKVEAFCRACGLPALADDSGLEVDALAGEPGPLHHLKGWDGRDQEERIWLLLDAVRDVPASRRTARFRSVIVVALPDGRSFEEEGVCEGMITVMPAGDNGWGYDPIFLLPERGVTLAQLSDREKNAVSHRGLAAARIRQRLADLAAG